MACILRTLIYISLLLVALLTRAETTLAAKNILTTPGPESIQMDIRYKQAPAAKIVRGRHDGCSASLDETALGQLEQRLEDFNAVFPDLQRGNIIRMDYVPGLATQLRVNSQAPGRIEGEDLFTALMQVWIGAPLADAGPNQGLPGQT